MIPVNNHYQTIIFDSTWPHSMAELQIGHRYSNLSSEQGLELLKEITPKQVWSAIGKHTRWAITDGFPWGRWHLNTWDANARCEVRARPWPWCWGDRFWVLGERDQIHFLLRLDKGGETELLLAPLTATEPEARKALWQWAREDANVFVEEIPSRRLNPNLKLRP
jgi:hypothetical protein